MTNQIAEALATLRRTDIHRPSAIIPADYEFVAFSHLKIEAGDLGTAHFVIAERKRLNAHMERTGGHYSQHAHGGNCHICGAHCLYTAVFHHKPTNTYIRTGLDCTDKLDDSIDGSEFRSRVSKGLEAVAGKRKAEATLTEAGLAAAWALYAAEFNGEPPAAGAAYAVWKDTCTIRDMVARLVQYGSISDKAMNFLRILTDRVANAAERQARFAAQSAAAAPLPATEERTLVEGEVVSVKAADARFPALGRKMVVRHPTGWKVYGRVPAAIDEDGLVGKRVRFVAAIKASDRDPKFGFFSRPTKAEVVA